MHKSSLNLLLRRRIEEEVRKKGTYARGLLQQNIKNNSMQNLKHQLILAGFILLAGANSLISQNKMEEEKFKGKVRSVSVTKTPQTGKEEERIIYKNGITFNEQGKKTGTWMEIGSGVMDGKSTFSYDANGNLLECLGYSGGNPNGKQTYKYDAKKQLTEKQDFYGDGKLNEKISYSYDEKGMLITEMKYDENEKLKYKNVYTYNEKAWCTQQQEYMYETLYDVYTNKYDANGNLTEVKFHTYITDTDVKDYTANTKYDTEGRWIENSQINEKGKLVTRTSATYDAMGNQVSYTEYTPDGKIKEKNTNTFEYDKTGNWIKQSYFTNGKLVSVTVREFMYF